MNTNEWQISDLYGLIYLSFGGLGAAILLPIDKTHFPIVAVVGRDPNCFNQLEERKVHTETARIFHLLGDEEDNLFQPRKGSG